MGGLKEQSERPDRWLDLKMDIMISTSLEVLEELENSKTAVLTVKVTCTSFARLTTSLFIHMRVFISRRKNKPYNVAALS